MFKWSFKLNNYEKLKQKQLDKLTPAARYFLKFLYNFGKYKKIKNTVKVATADDNLQSFDVDYCGPFQMYFYLSLLKHPERQCGGEVLVQETRRQVDRRDAERNIQHQIEQ